jgi:hypothetical protein
MADVSSNLYSWSTTASSNSPSGATNVGSGLDDNLRQLQATVREGLAHYNSVAVASAGSVDLGAQTGNFLIISGTTTITALGTVSAGIWKVVRFSGALTLTHNGTSLILPGAANITTVAGDVACFLSEGSGNWRCVWFQPTDGRSAAGILIVPTSASPAQTTDGSVVWDSDDDLLTVGTGATRKTMVDTNSAQTLTTKTHTSPVINTGISGTAVAAQADMETPSSSSLIVTPAVVKNHPGAVKYWCKVTFSGGTPSIAGASQTGGSMTDGGLGNTSVNMPVTFSSTATMAPVATIISAGSAGFIRVAITSTSVINVICQDSGGSASDLDYALIVCGDL